MPTMKTEVSLWGRRDDADRDAVSALAHLAGAPDNDPQWEDKYAEWKACLARRAAYEDAILARTLRGRGKVMKARRG